MLTPRAAIIVAINFMSVSLLGVSMPQGYGRLTLRP
jgi:hypothetical protein